MPDRPAAGLVLAQMQQVVHFAGTVAAGGWLPMICSTRLVPERGMPTMKTGTSLALPETDVSSKLFLSKARRMVSGPVGVRPARVAPRNFRAFA